MRYRGGSLKACLDYSMNMVAADGETTVLQFRDRSITVQRPYGDRRFVAILGTRTKNLDSEYTRKPASHRQRYQPNMKKVS